MPDYGQSKIDLLLDSALAGKELADYFSGVNLSPDTPDIRI
jgi:hypothetical protein